MDPVVRQVLKFAIVLMIGVSPIAHELCQLSCESPATAEAADAATTTGSSPHAHCAEAARANSAEHATILVAAPAPCRSASDLQDSATVVAKAVVHPLLPASIDFFAAPLAASSRGVHASDADRPAAPVSAQTPLRL